MPRVFWSPSASGFIAAWVSRTASGKQTSPIRVEWSSGKGEIRYSTGLFSGIVVGYLFKEQKIFEVVVWGAPEARASLANLRVSRARRLLPPIPHPPFA